MDKVSKMRFAVLVDGPVLKQWQIDCISNLIDSQLADCVSFFKPTSTSSSTSSPSKVSFGFKLIYRTIDGNGPLKRVNWQDQFSTVKVSSLNTEQKGISTFISDKDTAFVKDQNLDFIIRFGFGILKGDILNTPKFGIWSFHHGDPTKYRGGPAGLWEIIKGDPVTGAILQQLNEKLDQGNVIREGFFQTTNHSYKGNLYHVLNETSNWPTLAVQSILSKSGTIKVEPIKQKGKLYKVPSSWKSLLLIKKLVSNKIAFHLHRIFEAEKWNVGKVAQPIETLVQSDLKPIKFLNEAPTNQYYADPFTTADGNIFLELFDYVKNKGSLKILNTNAGKLTDLLESDAHFSYPFSIQDKGKSYILPENYKANSLCLYELNEKHQIIATLQLLEGPWIDPTLVKHDGLWWLFCMHQNSPKENLHLFHSTQLEGPYEPHLLNPVMTDIRCARPGGTPFTIDGQLIRPTQNCAKTYGGSIVLKQIIKLSPSEFEERFVKEILPAKGRYSKGLHTISKSGNEILVDAKRYYFNLFNFWHQLKASFIKK